MFPTIETKRLVLREITEADSAGIFACFSNNEVTRFYGQETLEDEDKAREFITFFSTIYQEKRGIRWGIEIKSTKEFIGTIGFYALSLKHKRAEIGYEIHPNHWRKGYASEAIRNIISYGFNELQLRRIGAVVFLENVASNKLLLGLGFEKEGVLKQYMYQNSIAYDTNIYGYLKGKNDE